MVGQELTESEEGATAPTSDSASPEWMIAADALSAVKKAVRNDRRARELLDASLRTGDVKATAKVVICDHDSYPVPRTAPATVRRPHTRITPKDGNTITLTRTFFKDRKSQFSFPAEWETSIFHSLTEPIAFKTVTADGSVMTFATQRLIAYDVSLSTSDIRTLIKHNASASYIERSHAPLISLGRKDSLILTRSQWDETLAPLIEAAAIGQLENIVGHIEWGMKKDIECMIIDLIEKRFGSSPSEATARRRATRLINMNTAVKETRSRPSPASELT